MQKMMNSLYWKLSAIFLALLLLSGTALLMFSRRASGEFLSETEQKLNRTLARDLAQRFEPFLRDSLDHAAIEHTFHELMVMNPRVEIYLLDRSGNLLAYFADEEKIKRMAVDLKPVQKFLNSTVPASFPIYGDDPRSPDRQKPFSAAPVLIGGNEPGFLYVILSGEQYDTIASMAGDSFILQTGAQVFGGTLLLTGVTGLLLFFLLTKRLRKVTSTVRKFEKGDFQNRAEIDSMDEIGQLGSAFNLMADAIVVSMEKIQQNDVLRRELIANVSHDLRSPLASIQGYLETVLMKETTLTPEKRREYLNTVYNNVSMLSRLVNELFELSKLDAKQVEPECEPFSIAELVQDMVLEFQPQAEEKLIQLRPILPSGVPFVHADIGMIERALSNLVENALDYTPKGGEVAVELTPDEGSVRIKVKDTGQGIEEGDLPHIFDRFYRADKSRSKLSGGTGLGLAIAQKIVEAHHTRISVASRVNQGTEFVFELPTRGGL